MKIKMRIINNKCTHLFSEQRSGTMDGRSDVSFDGTLLIHRLTNHIQNTTKSARADRNLSKTHYQYNNYYLTLWKFYIVNILTMMGAPVSFTGWPLTKPSVASMEIVRTVFSPRCWATSRTTLAEPAGTVTSRAFKIGGKGPSNYL